MPLESLLELVETLGDRIDRHSGALKQSEALTRYALIDPLLRELGWDTSDPGMVIPEYKSGNGRADYALMNNGSPAMMVEAKSLDTNLGGAVLSQGINYCLMEGTSHLCVTDGSVWEIYETHKQVPIDKKRIVRFDLKDGPAQVCLKALALWRPSVESGNVAAGQTPVIEPAAKPPPVTVTKKPTPPVAPVKGDGDWQPLSELNPVSGSPKPREIAFPDGSSVKIGSWNQIPIEVTRWLIDNDKIDMINLPVKRKTLRILSTSPFHKNGNSFNQPKQVGHLYLEVKYSSSYHTKNALLIIKEMGQDPAQFKVRLP